MPRKAILLSGIMVIVSLVCFYAFACAGNNSFVSQELGFSLNLPDGWKQEGNIDRADEAQVMKFIGDQGLAIITVTKGPAFTNFKENVLSELTQSPSNPNPSLEEINVNGIECIRTVVPVTQNDLAVQLPEGFNNIRVLTYFFNSPNAAYMITATPVFPKDFDAKRQVFEQIASSFQVLS